MVFNPHEVKGFLFQRHIKESKNNNYWLWLNLKGEKKIVRLVTLLFLVYWSFGRSEDIRSILLPVLYGMKLYKFCSRSIIYATSTRRKVFFFFFWKKKSRIICNVGLNWCSYCWITYVILATCREIDIILFVFSGSSSFQKLSISFIPLIRFYLMGLTCLLFINSQFFFKYSRALIPFPLSLFDVYDGDQC